MAYMKWELEETLENLESRTSSNFSCGEVPIRSGDLVVERNGKLYPLISEEEKQYRLDFEDYRKRIYVEPDYTPPHDGVPPPPAQTL